MASTTYQTLFFTLSLLCFPSLTLSDNPCPYPCYPPPIGGSTSQSPPAYPSVGGASYPPPAGVYPSPNYPTPPYDAGNNFYGPPPPDPILPYFPFYYRKPPHKPADSSSSPLPLLQKSILWAAAVANLAFFW